VVDQEISRLDIHKIALVYTLKEVILDVKPNTMDRIHFGTELLKVEGGMTLPLRFPFQQKAGSFL